ncbi:MAG: hypothetical protein J7M17_05830, partial [Anaerolineae bacterium]|nr:hypothetical protein [Anaerolineae bacterium]
EQLFGHFKSPRANWAYCEEVCAIHCDTRCWFGNLTYLDAYGIKSPRYAATLDESGCSAQLAVFSQ